jgi:hypothetical protein
MKPLLKRMFLSRDFTVRVRHADQESRALVVSSYRRWASTPTVPDWPHDEQFGQACPPNVAGWAGGRTWSRRRPCSAETFRAVLFPDSRVSSARSVLVGHRLARRTKAAQGMGTEATRKGMSRT